MKVRRGEILSHRGEEIHEFNITFSWVKQPDAPILSPLIRRYYDLALGYRPVSCNPSRY